VKAAMKAGRIYALMELLGTPEGLDMRVVAGGTTFELGDTILAASAPMLVVDIPRVHALPDPTQSGPLPTPVIHARVIAIAPGGAVTEIASSADGSPQLAVPLTAPGAYRVELSIVPRHLGPYLGDLGPDLAEVELPWIYASPFYVE
jgi:hypothetical protein